MAAVVSSLLSACGKGSGGGGGGDTTPPTEPANFTTTAAGSTSADLSWDASTDDVGVTGYIVSRDGIQVATPVTTSFLDSGLSPATTYDYTVVARDAAGNTSTPASASVTTAPGGGGDTTPPSQPAHFSATAAGSTAANLSWDASMDNVGVTDYVISRDGIQIATPVTTNFADTGLSPATPYSYTVVARDAAGNTSTAASASVTTAANPDTTSPSPLTGLNATAAGSTGANLSWTASTDDVAVTGYVISRDGVQIATVVTTSFFDSTLSPATSYSYTVVARDAAGNISTPGGASVTTAAAPPPYYVSDPAGNDSNTCAEAHNPSTPKKTIQAGLGCLAAGDTLIIRDGTYAGNANALTGASLSSGSPGNYKTIKAQNEGNVIITSGLSMDHTNAYLIFQGLRFQDSGGRDVLGNHLKFFRNEFKGGCDTGNCVNTSVGTNDFNDTADILFEDNWWHGSGGRYNLLVYNADRVVVRRAVIRHDGGWDDLGTKDPEAGLNFYNSTNCSAQNVIILDSSLDYAQWQSAFYSTHNSSSPPTNTNSNNSWLGIIALNDLSNGDGAGLRFDGDSSQSNHVVKDAVLWDVFSGVNVAYKSSVGVTASGLTIGQTTRGSVGIGLEGNSTGTKSFTNVIIANMDDDDIGSLSGPVTFFDTFNNGGSFSATGKVTYPPFDNGLLYLPRIEASGALKTAGFGGEQIGAQIVTRIGAAGTLQGEAGWDGDTGVLLWPFPDEARIMKEMCTDAGVTRGFCSDTSLTNYIMNYLGNGNPY